MRKRKPRDGRPWAFLLGKLTVVPSYFASAGAGLLAASNAALPSSVSRIYTSGFGVASAFSWPRIHLMAAQQ